MLEMIPATEADAATVAELWNQRRQEAESCWSQAVEADAETIETLLSVGVSIQLAVRDATPVGFGLWTGGGEQSRLVALAAANDTDYYALLAAFCQWSLAQDRASGFAELGKAAVVERARLDALGVIDYTPIGFDPLPPGEPAESRVPNVWRASCDCEVLLAAIAALEEEHS